MASDGLHGCSEMLAGDPSPQVQQGRSASKPEGEGVPKNSRLWMWIGDRESVQGMIDDHI